MSVKGLELHLRCPFHPLKVYDFVLHFGQTRKHVEILQSPFFFSFPIAGQKGKLPNKDA